GDSIRSRAIAVLQRCEPLLRQPGTFQHSGIALATADGKIRRPAHPWAFQHTQNLRGDLLSKRTEGGPLSADQRVDRESDSVARGQDRVAVIAADLTWCEGVAAG